MKKTNIEELIDTLQAARIFAGAEMGKLNNQNKYADAIVFMSIRDNIAGQINIIKEYALCKYIEEGKDETRINT